MWVVGERIACRDAATTRMVAMTVQVFDKSVDGTAAESRVGLLEEGAKVPITSNVFAIVILAVQGNVIIDESVYVGVRLAALGASTAIYPEGSLPNGY